jgi:hypothetical protein
MAWIKETTVTATTTPESLRVRVYTSDGGAPHPNELYFDCSVPADNEQGMVSGSGYCGDVLSGSSYAAFSALVASAMVALAASVQVPDYEGPAVIELYYSDGAADPPFAPRVTSVAVGYADQLLSAALASEVEQSAFVSLCSELRWQTLEQLGFSEAE